MSHKEFLFVILILKWPPVPYPCLQFREIWIPLIICERFQERDDKDGEYVKKIWNFIRKVLLLEVLIFFKM